MQYLQLRYRKHIMTTMQMLQTQTIQALPLSLWINYNIYIYISINFIYVIVNMNLNVRIFIDNQNPIVSPSSHIPLENIWKHGSLDLHKTCSAQTTVLNVWSTAAVEDEAHRPQDSTKGFCGYLPPKMKHLQQVIVSHSHHIHKVLLKKKRSR